MYPNLAGGILPTGQDLLWVANLTCIRLQKKFVFVAVLLDAWSRKMVGYAFSRYLNARLAVGALDAAVAGMRPCSGLIPHSDRGSQYSAKQYRDRLEVFGIKGPMGLTGNLYANARVENFFKMLKHEEVYAFEYDAMQDVPERLHSFLGYVPPEEFELVYAKVEGQIPKPCLST